MPRHATYVEDVATATSIRFNNRVYEMKQAGEDVIVLSLGEAFFDIPLSLSVRIAPRHEATAWAFST